jgi:alpha-amylase
MSNGMDGSKWMRTDRMNSAFMDLTGHISEPVVTNADGWGEFRCPGGKVSVWVQV